MLGNNDRGLSSDYVVAFVFVLAPSKCARCPRASTVFHGFSRHLYSYGMGAPLALTFMWSGHGFFISSHPECAQTWMSSRCAGHGRMGHRMQVGMKFTIHLARTSPNVVGHGCCYMLLQRSGRWMLSSLNAVKHAHYQSTVFAWMLWSLSHSQTNGKDPNPRRIYKKKIDPLSHGHTPKTRPDNSCEVVVISSCSSSSSLSLSSYV